MTSRVHRKSHHRALDNHTDFSLLSSRKVLQKKRKEKKRKEKKRKEKTDVLRYPTNEDLSGG